MTDEHQTIHIWGIGGSCEDGVGPGAIETGLEIYRAAPGTGFGGELGRGSGSDGGRTDHEIGNEIGPGDETAHETGAAHTTLAQRAVMIGAVADIPVRFGVTHQHQCWHCAVIGPVEPRW